MQKEIDIPLIINAVKKTGDLFLPDFRKTAIPNTREDSLIQLNHIEERCLTLLQENLSDAFPDTPWLGDEFDFEEQQKPLGLPEYWLCDTMDGAVQYMQHIVGWTINLVLVRDGRPYFAVIYDPYAQEMFWAVEGGGAFLNGNKINPSAKTDATVTLAVFEYAYQYKKVEGLNKKIGNAVTDLLENFGVVRNYGPCGLQLAYVGVGRIDFFYQPDLDTYNWLAGILIAKEAGAEILTADGRSWTWGEDSLLVATPGVGQKFCVAKSETQLTQ
ncbi:inositol monophosphatase family protein [Dyadobacter subterraneus]|uniref:Inositol monophosphatase n=1 Tax=Dyadobacter subterraneus TaxID=2773304 RepID=A0ABR9WDB1_9BACT|nr:inositol monophosphatase [Dyadobacter subterraneus]MBE9463470.1 inositol monophosphatase [Dyadobacter subterraneus]